MKNYIESCYNNNFRIGAEAFEQEGLTTSFLGNVVDNLSGNTGSFSEFHSHLKQDRRLSKCEIEGSENLGEVWKIHCLQ